MAIHTRTIGTAKVRMNRGQPGAGGMARRRNGVGRGVFDEGAHAAFTKQYVAGFTPWAVLSSFTTSSTVTRQLID